MKIDPNDTTGTRTRGWELFPHEADSGVRGFGPTLEAAFEEAAVALTAVATDPHHVVPRVAVEIECEAPDVELLFVDWLNALICTMSTRRMLFSRFEVAIEPPGRLRGRAYGEPVDRERHAPAAEAKGATYTALRVSETDGTWIAQCVVDV